ncbi:hypothetical protein V8C35DRAFT_250381 [Trichoderma chlorosporum]
METRDLIELVADVTELMAHAVAIASRNTTKSMSKDKNYRRRQGPLMGSLMATQLVLRDTQFGQEEKIMKRLPSLLKQLEGVCRVWPRMLPLKILDSSIHTHFSRHSYINPVMNIARLSSNYLKS